MAVDSVVVPRCKPSHHAPLVVGVRRRGTQEQSPFVQRGGLGRYLVVDARLRRTDRPGEHYAVCARPLCLLDLVFPTFLVNITRGVNHRFSPTLGALFKCESSKPRLKSSDFRDGTLMARAFRAGVEQHRKVRMPLRRRLWQPVRDLASLTTRAKTTVAQMGPLVEVPSLVRIENEHWIFERIEETTLYNLTHRLVVQTDEGEQVVGVTEDFTTALEVARCMAENEQHVVLIQPL